MFAREADPCGRAPCRLKDGDERRGIYERERERERGTCSCPGERFLADDEGLNVRVGGSRTVDVMEADQLVVEIGTKEGEKGTGLFYSCLE